MFVVSNNDKNYKNIQSMNGSKIMFITANGVEEFIPKRELDEAILGYQKSQEINSKVGELKSADKEKKLYTIADTQKIFNTSRPTIYNWMEHGILSPIKIGGRVYFSPKSVEDLISQKAGE